jgi:hypothetical protein
LRGEEATLGATAARKQPARQPRTSPESPAAAQLILSFQNMGISL